MVDNLDKEILNELSLNCRQSLNELSKKLKSKKTVVDYRIKRLESEGVIAGYYTLTDSFALGYESYRIYFSFKDLTAEFEKKIVDFFKADKRVYFLGLLEGRYDLAVAYWVKNSAEVHEFCKGFLEKFRKHIESYVVTLYDYTIFGSEYLSKKKNKERKEWVFSPKISEKLDAMDLKILEKVSYNAKFSVVEVAGKVNTTAVTIANKVKNLQKIGIIKAFRADIDFALLGYKWFKVDFFINNYKDYNLFVDYIKNNSNTYVLDRSLIGADIEAEFHYKDVDELRSFLNKLVETFPGVIKNYQILSLRKVEKIDFVPKG